MATIATLLLAGVRLLDESPEPEDVTAGWTAFAIFGLGLLTVALLGISLTRHLRRAAQAETEGRFGFDDSDETAGNRRDGEGRPTS